MKSNWFENNGFDPEKRVTYVIVGEDTYSIKDILKEAGFKYNKVMGWHGPAPIDVSEYGCHCCKVRFEDVGEEASLEELRAANGGVMPKNYQNLRFGFKAGCVDFMRNLRSKFIHVYSKFYDCKAGDRVEVLCRVTNKSTFNSTYGQTNIYNFVTDDDCLFVWFTKKELDIPMGSEVTLKGTVKELKRYRDNAQTVVTRCVVKEV